MTELKIYGVPHSSFVRSTRLALEERRVPYTLVPCPPGHADGEARHPFGRIPFMRYGDFVLAESIAIIRFAERTFPPGGGYGLSLWPAEPKPMALCDQWVSAISDSVSRSVGGAICFPRLAAPIFGMPVEEASVATAAGKLPAILAEFEKPLSAHPYLVNDALSLADLYLIPILHYLAMTPEGKAALPAFPKLEAWRARMNERASVKATVPPSFELLRPAA
jgi:glutathione S-transferase